MAKDYSVLEKNIKEIIDDLKGLCSQNGLSNQAPEEIIVTSVFLYKFLNDKFIANLHKFAIDIDITYDELLHNKDEYIDAYYDSYPQDVAFKYEDTIDYLVDYVARNDFYKIFDDTLERISKYKENESFNVDTADGSTKPLFTRLSDYIEPSKRNAFAQSVFSYITRDRFDFGEAFEGNYDFFSTIFEYLISDYNVASGTYAEYFTPQVVSAAIAKILVHMSPVDDKLYEIYDPSAGSGSLVLHLANELGNGKFGNKAVVYTQDISQKSSRFLRINMLLNGLTSSLDNIIEGDTLVSPAHYQIRGNQNSGLKTFDYITSNPPFKMDFSSTRDSIEQKWAATDRFFAGVPNIPNSKKDSMGIYLCFLQHILYSLKSNGKAAIVVPTGFITAQSGIEKKIRQKIIDNKWLKGAISMPSNIFANTGTNVSILFIDKSNEDGNVLLMDASKKGHKAKIKDIQKTILDEDELNEIVDTFINCKVVDDFTVVVTYDDIKNKNYSLAAGQYFKVKFETEEISASQFREKIDNYKHDLISIFDENAELDKNILRNLEDIKYDS